MKFVKGSRRVLLPLTLAAALTPLAVFTLSTLAAGGQGLSEAEKTLRALELQVELNRLGSAGDPIEREALLRRILQECSGTEEADAARWTLCDLYLDAFEEPREKEARAVLETLARSGSRWTAQAKCRLLALSDGENPSLRQELREDGAIPAMLRPAL